MRTKLLIFQNICPLKCKMKFRYCSSFLTFWIFLATRHSHSLPAYISSSAGLEGERTHHAAHSLTACSHSIRRASVAPRIHRGKVNMNFYVDSCVWNECCRFRKCCCCAVDCCLVWPDVIVHGCWWIISNFLASDWCFCCGDTGVSCMEGEGAAGARRSTITPKAVIHTKFGSKASYVVEEVVEPAQNGCPGLSIPQKGPCLYRCRLELPELSVVSGTFRKKKDAEQDAAQKALHKVCLVFLRLPLPFLPLSI